MENRENDVREERLGVGDEHTPGQKQLYEFHPECIHSEFFNENELLKSLLSEDIEEGM